MHYVLDATLAEPSLQVAVLLEFTVDSRSSFREGAAENALVNAQLRGSNGIRIEINALRKEPQHFWTAPSRNDLNATPDFFGDL
jgi:hypothetical protein